MEPAVAVMRSYTSDVRQSAVKALGKVPHAFQVVLIPHSFCPARLVHMATATLTFWSKLQMQFHFCQKSRPPVTAYSAADQRLRPMSKLTSTPCVKENNCWFAADWRSVSSSRESLNAVWCVYQPSVKKKKSVYAGGNETAHFWPMTSPITPVNAQIGLN